MVHSVFATIILCGPSFAHRININRQELNESQILEESQRDPVQTLVSLPPGTGDVVDWHFMTETFSWAGREQSQYDVVERHACQGERRSDNSYYAASLCYWHPETEHAAPDHWGLIWRGGYGSKEFCGGLGVQRGVCAKCSVCHDNSRDRDAEVDTGGTHVEIIPLPDCLKEGAIESTCLNEFQADNGGLVNENGRCQEVQGRFNEAVTSWNTINSNIATSETSISVLMNSIVDAHQQVDDWRSQGREARRQLNRAKREAENGCRSFNGFERLTPTTVMLLSRPRCPAEEQQRRRYQRCQRCNSRLDALQQAQQARQRARQQLQHWEGEVVQREQEMQNHRAVVAQAYQNLPAATHYKQVVEQEWLPQQQHCQQVLASAANARNAHMMVCPQRYYNQSCEKACVEIQRNGDHGCGVIEGSQDGDTFARGGVEVTCSPPAPSWIMSPSNYGGSPQPNSGEQCGRIMAEQSVRATTPVVMSGWLEKDCHHWCFGMDRRFFVLESGNGVRSANLRYFGADPRVGGTEHTNMGIIMWDAEEVSTGETSQVQACLELKHHFRGRTQRWLRRGTTYTICVTQEMYPNNNINELRDQWVSALQQFLVWQPRVV